MVDLQKQGTYEKVVAVIAEVLTIPQNSIHPVSQFEGLGADSLDTLEIIIKLEETFGIEISDDEASKITTVQEAVSKIDEILSKK